MQINVRKITTAARRHAGLHTNMPFVLAGVVNASVWSFPSNYHSLPTLAAPAPACTLCTQSRPISSSGFHLLLRWGLRGSVTSKARWLGYVQYINTASSRQTPDHICCGTQPTYQACKCCGDVTHSQTFGIRSPFIQTRQSIIVFYLICAK